MNEKEVKHETIDKQSDTGIEVPPSKHQKKDTNFEQKQKMFNSSESVERKNKEKKIKKPNKSQSPKPI